MSAAALQLEGLLTRAQALVDEEMGRACSGDRPTVYVFPVDGLAPMVRSYGATPISPEWWVERAVRDGDAMRFVADALKAGFDEDLPTMVLCGLGMSRAGDIMPPPDAVLVARGAGYHRVWAQLLSVAFDVPMCVIEPSSSTDLGQVRDVLSTICGRASDAETLRVAAQTRALLPQVGTALSASSSDALQVGSLLAEPMTSGLMGTEGARAFFEETASTPFAQDEPSRTLRLLLDGPVPWPLVQGLSAKLLQNDAQVTRVSGLPFWGGAPAAFDDGATWVREALSAWRASRRPTQRAATQVQAAKNGEASGLLLVSPRLVHAWGLGQPLVQRIFEAHTGTPAHGLEVDLVDPRFASLTAVWYRLEPYLEILRSRRLPPARGA